MHRIAFLSLTLLALTAAHANPCALPAGWQALCSILEQRVTQTSAKMRLEAEVVQEFAHFLQRESFDFVQLRHLQTILPKTTVELLMGVRFRGVAQKEAEAIARYLMALVSACDFKNLRAFDNNTSHIIGREWGEIDYSGEGMTPEKQKAKYAPYRIENFKTLKNIQRFFPVEAKAPYFARIYKPAAGGTCVLQKLGPSSL